MIQSLFFAIGIYLLLVLFFNWYEYEITYYPSSTEAADLSHLQVQDIFLTSSDQIKIHAVYKEQKKELVFLFCHGNGGNISYNLGNLEYLDQTGYSYLMLEYPGYGKSEGRTSEQGLYHAAQAAYDFLTEEKGFRADQLIAYGHSIGGAVCIDLASKNPVRSLIIQSGIASSYTMSKHILPFFPPKLFFISNKYDSLTRLKNITVPILFLHGKQDLIIPPSQSQLLYEAAKEPKYLYIVPGFGHNEVIPAGPGEHVEAIRAFIKTSQIKQ